MSERKMKAVMAWAGVVEGKIHVTDAPDFDGMDGSGGRHKSPALFKSRKAARREYEKVIRVEIREVRK